MQKYFNVNLEFDHQALYEKIESAIIAKDKGYVCVVDANVLTIAQKNLDFKEVLNHSLVNTCDGSSIAFLAGMIYKEDFRALNGPEIFSYYIEQNHSQLLLGSDHKTSEEIKAILRQKGIDDSHISVLPLPFDTIENFDYIKISEYIKAVQPEIIWVSLGAPKQEFFMCRLLPFLESGIMFGIGAAFNFYIGKISLPTKKIGVLKFIWVSRILSEPKKQIARIFPYIKLLPNLYLEERRKRKGSRFLS